MSTIANSSAATKAEIRALTSGHSSYFCHLFAGTQIDGDPKVYDLSGALNHASRGSGLTTTELWATSGYFSTVLAADNMLELPALNLDYAGGESLLIWWLGATSPEGSTVNFMGDNPGLTGSNGIRLRMPAAGTVAMTLNEGTTTAAMTATTGVALDGTLHSFGIFLDGVNRTVSNWIDEVEEAEEATFNSGNPIDTTTSTGLYLGGTSSGAGIDIQTRALVIMKFASADVPTYANVTTAINMLRAAPGRLIRSDVL
jgi:hypothetical protein